MKVEAMIHLVTIELKDLKDSEIRIIVQSLTASSASGWHGTGRIIRIRNS